MKTYYIIFTQHDNRFDTVANSTDAYAIAASIGGQVVTVRAASLAAAREMEISLYNGMVCYILES